MITVKNIREQEIKITKGPIVYYWWFKTSCFNELFSNFPKNEINFNKLLFKEIENETFALLYIGKGKNGNDRLIKYHILDSQNFHNSGVENGRLSSLRQTLCGLLNLRMSKSKVSVDDFMDKNCFVEYEACIIDQLDNLENEKIRNHYLPLNYQNTKGILTSSHRKILSESKKQMRN